jgi:ABC-type transport system involved in cytochrome c biogenesis permease subunit
LVTLDDLFFKFLTFGFTFMTLGLLFGIVWAEQTWIDGWFKDPKVVAAMATWTIYLILIYLRASAGWRGRRAAWMSFCGFISVLFTYIGARFLGGQHTFLQ